MTIVYVGDKESLEIKEVDWPDDDDPGHWGHWGEIGGWYSPDRSYLVQRLLRMRQKDVESSLKAAQSFQQRAAELSAQLVEFASENLAGSDCDE